MNDRYDIDARPPDEASRSLDSATCAFQSASRELGVTAGACAEADSRRYAERMLRMQGMTLNAMTDGVALVDRDGRIEFANPAFNRMFGGAPRERAALMKLLHRVPNGRTRHDILSRRGDGSQFACEVSLLDWILPVKTRSCSWCRMSPSEGDWKRRSWSSPIMSAAA
jgi:PAS domain-containing protein